MMDDASEVGTVVLIAVGVLAVAGAGVRVAPELRALIVGALMIFLLAIVVLLSAGDGRF